MSAAVNLTEGEEFLWPSENFWSGAEAAQGKASWRIFTVHSTVSNYPTVWFLLLIRNSLYNVIDALLSFLFSTDGKMAVMYMITRDPPILGIDTALLIKLNNVMSQIVI